MRVDARVLLTAVVLACGGPADAPAQVNASATAFVRSDSPAVRSAVASLNAGRPWRATEILDSAYRSTPRPPEIILLGATASATWGGWSRVERDLSAAPWLDSLYDGRGRELLARAALARGADSLARIHAEAAIARARTPHDRGVREVLLARALDRQAIGDKAAESYLKGAQELPSIADWLELRAAGTISSASERQRLYAGVRNPVARTRIGPTEAQARERWRDFDGAAKTYADLGQRAQALRVRLLTNLDSSARKQVRGEALGLLTPSNSMENRRLAIALLDSSLGPLSGSEELIVARAANDAALFARAAAGYARVEKAGLDDRDRYAYASLLSRLGRDADAGAQFGRIPANSAMGATAAYQRARSLLRAGNGANARTALRAVARAHPNAVDAAAPALYLLADLATDDAREDEARTGLLELVRRFPSSHLAPSAMFRAATIAYASESFTNAARELDSLVARYPRSVEASAARYWSGRSRDRNGDKTGAQARWREVIETDPLSYYSLLSARRLGIAPWRPAPAAESLKTTAALDQAVSRAALLDALGMATEEDFEYDAMVSASGKSPDSLLAAADALRERGEVSRAMAMARRALAASATRDTRLFQLLYPLPYPDVIRAEAAAKKIEPSLLAALIHQESSFNPRAVSRAGAVGPMQVLPSVGAAIAKAQGMSGFERVLLNQPDVNVRLGTAHLDAMLDQYPRVEYALAAYNAGGTPVRRWRARRGSDDPELFIERIPYDETRDYVRILLRNQATYATLYKW